MKCRDLKHSEAADGLKIKDTPSKDCWCLLAAEDAGSFCY
jgi:hypothetical protein